MRVVRDQSDRCGLPVSQSQDSRSLDLRLLLPHVGAKMRRGRDSKQGRNGIHMRPSLLHFLQPLPPHLLLHHVCTKSPDGVLFSTPPSPPLFLSLPKPAERLQCSSAGKGENKPSKRGEDMQSLLPAASLQFSLGAGLKWICF